MPSFNYKEIFIIFIKLNFLKRYVKSETTAKITSKVVTSANSVDEIAADTDY